MNTVLLLFVRRISLSICLIWVVLVAIFALFELLKIVDDTTFLLGLLLVFLKIPLFALETLPFVCPIGTALALRIMVNSNEMIVLRTAGLSHFTICRYQIIAGIPFVIAFLILSEILIPTGSQITHSIKNSSQVINNLWLKDNNDYIHINRLLPDHTMSSVVIYHTDENQLLSITEADTGKYIDGGWKLNNVEFTQINNTELFHSYEKTKPWLLSFLPSSLESFLKKPKEMALWEATQAAINISNSGQINQPLLQTVWQRWITLPSLFLLIAIGVLFHSTNKKQQFALPILMATLIGGLFFILREISIHLSIITDTWILLPLSLMILVSIILVALKKLQ